MVYPKTYRNQYIEQDVMGASPAHLVVMTYDLAIKACKKQDFAKSIQVVTVLRDTLDFEYKEVATGLFRLYQWVLDCIRSGDYNGALVVLVELRNAWAQAELNMKAGARLPEPSWAPMSMSTQPA